MKKFMWRLALGIATVMIIVAIAPKSKAADNGGPDYYDPTSVVAAAPTKKDLWSGLYVEGGVGMTVSSLDIANAITLGEDAIVAHAGIGYDALVSPHIVAGVFVRAEIDEIKHKIGGTPLAKNDIAYMVGGRLGWVPRGDAMIYVLGGAKWSDLDFSSGTALPDKARMGWVGGAGVEMMLTNHVAAGLEYTGTFYGGENVGGIKVDTVDHSGRATLKWKF